MAPQDRSGIAPDQLARGELNGHLQGCQQQQAALAAKKGSTRNNLAGATWEASISAETQAAATTCDTKARDIRAKLESKILSNRSVGSTVAAKKNGQVRVGLEPADDLANAFAPRVKPCRVDCLVPALAGALGRALEHFL